MFERKASRQKHLANAAEDEHHPPPWTPLPGSATANGIRRALMKEPGPVSSLVYCAILLNALVLCLHRADASNGARRALSGVS